MPPVHVVEQNAHPYGTLNPRDEAQAAYAAFVLLMRLGRVALAVLLCSHHLVGSVYAEVSSCSPGGAFAHAQALDPTVTLTGSVKVG